MPRAFQARVVYPVDSPPLEHGVVTVDAGRIVAVSKAGSADVRSDEVTDLGDVAIVPGLVNAHAHLEFSHLERPLGRPGMGLAEWIRLVIEERGARSERRGPSARTSIEAGLSESSACWVTTVGEIATAEAAAYELGGWGGGRSSDRPPSEPGGSLRSTPATPIDLTLLIEVIGFSRARAASALAATAERLAAAQSSLLDPRHSLGISPHAPYTVSPELLRLLVALAIEHGLPVAMHLAESREELELLSKGSGPLQELLDERSMWDAAAIPRGCRPLDYLKMLAETPRAIVIHGNYLDAESRAFLAENAARMSLVYCPRTHAYFDHEPYPLAELLAAGVRVAVGTDSRASNPDLSVLAELHHVARTFPTIAPSAILRLGTLAGAEALGRAKEVGSIAPGKRADLVAIPLDAATGGPEELLAAMLADSEGEE